MEFRDAHRTQPSHCALGGAERIVLPTNVIVILCFVPEGGR